MKKRIISLTLVLCMLLSLLPATVLAADGPSAEDFFAGVQGVATAANDETYPFTVDTETEGGPWLKSGKITTTYVGTELTVTMLQTATLQFDYRISCSSSCGMSVENGSRTICDRWDYNGEKEGTVTVEADAGDEIVIRYYRGYVYSSDTSADCLWIKNIRATLPAQVTLHSNDGTDQTIKQGIRGEAALQPCPFDYDMHAFLGWAAEPGGEVVYDDQETISISEDADLYAVWAQLYPLHVTLLPSPMEKFELYRDEEKQNPAEPLPETSLDYALEPGTYYWAAGQFGYESQSGTVQVGEGQDSLAVTLKARPAETVTFRYGEPVNGPVKKGSLTVKTGERIIAPAETESTAYVLPRGFSYTYTFKSANYKKQSGTIDLTEEGESGGRTVEIPLEVKTAWEGPEDLTEPQLLDGVYQIGSGAELAWYAREANAGRANTTDAVLTGDIDLGNELWTPLGSSNYGKEYKATFDGRDHTVTGIRVEVTGSSESAGFFGVVREGTIKNLTAQGTVSGKSTSSSYGTGGLVGNLKIGSEIENCVSNVKVTGGNNVGGIAGLASGYQACSISCCVNLGEVSGNNSVGGLIGYLYNKSTVRSSYNRGSVHAEISKAGGLAGYVNDSNAMLRDCYTTGTVTAEQNADPGVGMLQNGRTENCYCLSNLGSSTCCTGKTESEMKGKAFPGLLGGDFYKDMAEPVNDGYPILAFQDTTPRFDVTIAVVPAWAELILRDADGISVAGEKTEGTWSYRLTDGSYTWEASAFGKITGTGSFTVAGSAVSETVELEDAPTVRTIFSVSFQDDNPDDVLPEITVACGERRMEADENGVYALPCGEYTYAVKAKGYAKVTGAVTVSEENQGEASVWIILEPSDQWDGESTEKPAGSGTEEDPYRIENGAQLAWLAQFVNQTSSNAEKAHAELLDDIDLGENPWTPIGKNYSYYYKSNFDGRGHHVKGLLVEDQEYAGLFGTAQNAEISSVIVEGSIEGTRYTGSLIAYVNRNVIIRNCGSECTVTSSGDWTGGLLGRIYGSNVTLDSCYNTGNVTGSPLSGGYAGGIIGKIEDDGIFNNCYNTGAVNAYYAGGIAGSGYYSAKLNTCYNAGLLGGNTTAGICTGSSGTCTNCYYLEPAGDDHSGTTLVDADSLKAMTDTLNEGGQAWKSAPDMNGGFPVLSWQKEEGGQAEPQPEENLLPDIRQAGWKEDPGTGLLTGVAAWEAAEDAESYTVVLWDMVTTETTTQTEVDGEMVDTTVTVNTLTAVRTLTGVTGTTADFTEDIETRGSGCYCFTVTPIAAADSGKTSPEVPADEIAAENLVGKYLNPNTVWYYYTARLRCPEGLFWNGPCATWDYVENAYGYILTLYRLEEDGTIVFVASGPMEAAERYLNCQNYFVAGNRYVFAVQALSEEYLMTGIEDKNSPVSALSSDPVNGGETAYGIFEAKPETEPEKPDRTDWIPISSAEDWIELANTEDTIIDPQNPEITEQSVAWGKKYYLTADLDFSNLSAADSTKTKSIGRAAHPFTGKMDGNGHRILGLTLSNLDAGLFGYIGGTGEVYGLTVDSANVLFSDNAAVIVYSNKGTIHDCGVVNCNITADTGAVLGGFVSRNYGVITDSYVECGRLTSNSDSATGHAGFAGAQEEGGRIERCWSSMDVSTCSEYAGGFVGLNYGGPIRNCFSLGNVKARSYSGGFAGRSVYGTGSYENCYAAGTLTVTGEEGHGFIGGSKPDSAFQPDLSREVINCYYNAASPEDEFAADRTLEEMKKPAFLNGLNQDSVYMMDAGKNGGLPFLTSVKAPEKGASAEITVTIALAVYDKEEYSFRQLGDSFDVTMLSYGNTRVVDVMDAAQEQGLVTYSYETSPEYGRFIHTINGYSVEKPDGWMFTINDVLSNNGASTATVKDQNRLLWFEGTTENHFQPPLWEDLAGMELQWINIGTKEELLALSESEDDAVLAGNYRLSADLDLSGEEFNGIGSLQHPFTGVFDGRKHTVSNVTVNGGENAGFFNVICDATVKNLNLTNISVTGTERVGGLAGWAQVKLSTEVLTDNEANLLGSCTVTGAVSGKKMTGGLVGLNDSAYDKDTLFSVSSSVDKCTAEVTVQAPDSDSEKIGGLAGDNRGIITKSSACGNVSAPGGAMVGGLTGASSGAVYDSHAEGDVTGQRTVGGFTGSGSGPIKRCYSLGNVMAQENTGSFAGALSEADFVIGAGLLTIAEGSTSGYCGGFAGTLSGTLAGLPGSITVKDAFGNCVQPGKEPLTATGNAFQYPGETNEAALKAMALTTKKAVADRLFEMFGVKLKNDADLQKEADKYFSAIAAGEPGVIDLLKPGMAADPNVTVTFAADHPLLEGGTELTLLPGHTTADCAAADAAMLFTDAFGETLEEKITVLIMPEKEAVMALLDSIAADYTDVSTDWEILDMAVYAAISGTELRTSDEAKQAALDRIIAMVQNPESSINDHSKAELVLRAMGIDSTELHARGIREPLSNAAFFETLDCSRVTVWEAPWILLAELQGNFTLTEKQTADLMQVMTEHIDDWPGPDTDGMVLSAIASRAETDPAAGALQEKLLARLAKTMDEKTGTCGSANSDAMVILGLLANGRMLRAGDTNINSICSLLTYVNPETGQFQFAGNDNAMATEQGFRALAAVMNWNGQAYQAYDFSSMEAAPGYAAGAAEEQPAWAVEAMIGELGEITLESEEAVLAARNAYNALTEGQKALIHNYETLMAAEEKLAELQKPEPVNRYKDVTDDDWFYPHVMFVTEKGLMNGTDVDLFSPEDSMTRGMFAAVLYRMEGRPKAENVPDFTDVAPEDYYADAISWAMENKIMMGYGENLFGPEDPITREQMVTSLYRYAGFEGQKLGSSAETDSFADGNLISPWALDAMTWAVREGLILGMENNRLNPAGLATRAQCAAVFMRYLEMQIN